MAAHDWFKLNSEYENSDLTLREFCKLKNIAHGTMRNQRHRLKQKKNTAPHKVHSGEPFKKLDKVPLKSECQKLIKIEINDQNLVSLHGIHLDHLPQILRAIHAL